MWRFLHNIPRALKNYHGPRASVGVYVESDEKDHEQEISVKQEQEISKCVDHVPRKQSCCIDSNQVTTQERTFLLRLVQRNHSHSSDDQNEKKANHEEWWHAYQRDIWAFLQRSNRMLEAFTVGSSFLWGSRLTKRKQKSDLVYRVLFSVSGKDETVNICKSILEDTTHFDYDQKQTPLAIKDAAGSAQDGIINQSKSSTLDAALKEFEYMCSDYIAQNDSLLALMAYDKGDMSEAVENFRSSCSMGNKTACFNLGLCYERGLGVSRNVDKAKHYYELAAKKGHSLAMYNLSLLYLNGDEGIEVEQHHKEKAMKHMENAARLGLAQAQTYMGMHHMEETRNEKLAAAYFKAAADQKDVDAQYFLALCHEHGLGLEVNECRAAHLYSIAASLGHSGAMYNLASFIENGLGGIPTDPAAAIELYTHAAELGNEDAKHRLEELNAIKQQEREQRKLLYKMEETGEASSAASKTSCSHHKSVISSFFSLNSDILYERLYEAFQASDSRKQTEFDPGGVNDQGRLGGYNEHKDGVSVKDCSTKFPSACDDSYLHVSNKPCRPVHRSHTTPDLTSMVACNI